MCHSVFSSKFIHDIYSEGGEEQWDPSDVIKLVVDLPMLSTSRKTDLLHSRTLSVQLQPAGEDPFYNIDFGEFEPLLGDGYE